MQQDATITPITGPHLSASSTSATPSAPPGADRAEPFKAANADVFSYAVLAQFALSPTGSHLFRAQHESIVRLMNRVLETLASRKSDSGGWSLVARNGLTDILSMIQVHQSFEDDLLRRSLASDARSRMLHEQLERDVAPILSSLAALGHKFSTPSSIEDGPDEFFRQASEIFERVQDRFRMEERQLHSLYDRHTLTPLSAVA